MGLFIWAEVISVTEKIFRQVYKRDLAFTSLALVDNDIGQKYWIVCWLFKKYKTFSVLIYSYINTSGNWKNEKL